MPQGVRGNGVFRFGGFELEPEGGDLRRRRSGARVKLQPQPLNLLSFLVRRAGTLVTRAEVQQEIWHSDTFVDFEQGVNACIKQVRSALGDDPKSPRYIQTLPRRGYRFIAPVRKAKRVRPSGEALSQMLTTSGQQGRDRPIQIAVLPLNNFSGNPAQEYFADGITDALITQLAKINAMRVISRTSVMQYKGEKKSLSQIARKLNVDAIVEGAVMRSGNRVRITVRLVDTATDRYLWAESYERDLRDIFALQSEVALAIANGIQAKLTPQEHAHLASPRQVDPEAYEDYLKGRYYWHKRTEDGLTKSVEYFQRAIQKDPRCSLAYAGLADSYTLLAYWEATTLPPKDGFEKAKATAQKALELDDTLAEAHTSMAWVKLFYEKDWAGAEQELKLATALNMNYTMAHHSYALYLTAMARHEEAIAESKKAQRLDPISPIVNMGLAWSFHYARRYDQAIEQSNVTLEMDGDFAPAHYTLGLALEQKAMYEEAIAEFQRATTHPRPRPLYLSALGHVYGASGRKAKAQKLLQEWESISKERYVSPYELALLHVGLGSMDQAFASLQKACEERSHWLILLKVEPRLDGLRADSRFAHLLRSVGLTP